jgi:hypothetical protein
VRSLAGEGFTSLIFLLKEQTTNDNIANPLTKGKFEKGNLT